MHVYKYQDNHAHTSIHTCTCISVCVNIWSSESLCAYLCVFALYVCYIWTTFQQLRSMAEVY